MLQMQIDTYPLQQLHSRRREESFSVEMAVKHTIFRADTAQRRRDSVAISYEDA